MSCLIWLPLNGDLRNNGLLSVTPVQSGGSFVAGKTGKCFDTGGSGTIKMQNSIPINKEFTFSVWVNMNEMTPAWARVFGLYYSSNDYIGLCLNGSASALGFHVYSNVNGAKTNIVDSYAFPMGTNEWHHITVTCDSNNMHRWYYDSSLVWSAQRSYDVNTTYSLLQIGQIEGISSAKCNCKVCDFRFYDTALSPYEIKLLSQAAILKFPLDNNGLGAPNLFNTSGTISITSNGSVELIDGGVKTTGLDKDTYFRIPLVETLTANTTYTVSCQATGMEEGKALRFGVVSQSSGFNMSIHNGLNVFSFTPTADVSTSLMFDDNLRTGLPIVTMTNWKLERGTKASPYVPSGLPVDTTIYDTSGFGNNATAANVTYSGDTARYTASSVFVSGSKITLPTITCSGFADSYTFAWWEKSTDANNKMAWGFSNGNRLNLYRTGGYYCWNTGDGGNNKFGTLSTSLTADGNWHHLAVTGDGTTTKLYIDGEFKANATAYKPLTGTQIYISGWDTGTGYFWDGSLSDFRIYGTALSAEDIYELYKVSAKIDRKGTMYSYGYVEE